MRDGFAEDVINLCSYSWESWGYETITMSVEILGRWIRLLDLFMTSAGKREPTHEL